MVPFAGKLSTSDSSILILSLPNIFKIKNPWKILYNTGLLVRDWLFWVFDNPYLFSPLKLVSRTAAAMPDARLGFYVIITLYVV